MVNLIQLFIFFFTNILIITYFNFLSKYFNLFDIPNKTRKKQIQPVSLFGGFIFAINLNLFLFFDVYYDINTLESFFGLKTNIQLFTFILIFHAIYLIGYSDDKFDLRPLTKLILVSICLYLIIFFNQDLTINSLRSDLIKKEIDFFLLAPYFTIFCVLCFMNAMNMFDGINLASFLQFFLIALIILIENKIDKLSLMMLFSLVVFGYLNFKNFSFLGDSGVYILSFFCSFLLIVNYKINNLNVEEIIILIYLPMLDFIRLFFSRIYKGLNPFSSDENHFHHIILRKFKFNLTILIIFLMIYIPVLLNYILGYTNLILLSFIIIYFILLKKVEKKTI